jgi:hypothetical protein
MDSFFIFTLALSGQGAPKAQSNYRLHFDQALTILYRARARVRDPDLYTIRSLRSLKDAQKRKKTRMYRIAFGGRIKRIEEKKQEDKRILVHLECGVA